MTDLESISAQALQAAAAGDRDAARALLGPLREGLREDAAVAIALVEIVDRANLGRDWSLEVLAEVHAAWADDEAILARLGEALESARDIDDLNAAAPEHPLFADVVRRLTPIALRARGQAGEIPVLRGLATAARMCARQHDTVAERTYRRLVQLEPDNASAHYNLGLFYKTRGRFRDGMASNSEARNLIDEPVNAYEWNFGICATGAGAGDAALAVWKQLGQKIEMGRFGLPDGGYPQCKVRLAERPLAERGAGDDDPGLEETIWIQRLSPCHGIVRSVLYQELGVDFGDVVLFDGAPITYHSYGETQVPVFPHLATLRHNGYRFYDFAGTQDAAGRLADASTDLERDAVVYAHSENFRVICAACWRDPDVDHARHESEEKHVVTGRIAAPGDVEPAELLAQLDRAVIARAPCRIFAPDLCEAAGAADRERIERRRFAMLADG